MGLRKMKFIFIFKIIIFLIFLNSSKANEVKIISKIGNEIITNIDVENEYNYLITLNTTLRDIDKNKVILFAKNSLIKEKIKKNEIEKYYELNNKNQTVDLMIENIFKKLGIENLNQFSSYLDNNNLNFDEVYKKIEIEAVWNQMIYHKFKDKIYIDEEELRKKVKNNQQKIETLLLSEILINIENKNEIDKKYNELIENINKFGFKETVIKYSISSSRNNSGLLGWVNKNNLSKNIQNSIKDLNSGDVSKPILISSGMLVLKLEDRKFEEPNKNIDQEFQKLFEFEMNSQLNNFSNIYFNKVKKKFLKNE